MRWLLALLLITPCLAQDLKVDPELTEAIAERDAAQAKIDSIMASRELIGQTAAIEAVFPHLVKAGVTLEVSKDPLYTILQIPYAKATDEDRLLWREARLKALEAVGSGAMIETNKPWEWQIHRADLVKVCSAFAAVVAPEE